MSDLLKGMEEIAKAARINRNAVLDAIRTLEFPAKKRDGTITGDGPWYAKRSEIERWWDDRLKLGFGSH